MNLRYSPTFSTNFMLESWIDSGNRLYRLQEMTGRAVDSYLSSKPPEVKPVRADRDLQAEARKVGRGLENILGMDNLPVPRVLPLDRAPAAMQRSIMANNPSLPKPPNRETLLEDTTGWYDKNHRIVYASTDSMPILLITMAHEIIHYLQFMFLSFFKEIDHTRAFREGHAIGVERLFALGARDYSEGLRYESLKSDARLLGFIYLKLSRVLGFLPLRDLALDIRRMKPSSDYPHSLGAAAFLLLQQEQGEDIYGSILRNHQDPFQ